MRELAAECLRMDDIIAIKPALLKDGSGWLVEVTYGDGRLEYIGTFGSDTTARDWIEWDAPKFFRAGCA
jgi:hypothetical protein